MGPLSFRTYHEVAGEDRSQLGEQVSAQRERVSARMRLVTHVIAVMSGKGGVGKSYVTAGMALALARRGYRVGVLDADLASPTVARMLDASGPLRIDSDGAHPARARIARRMEGQVTDPSSNIPSSAAPVVFSSDLLLADGAPLRWKEPGTEQFVWRSVLETGALREFLSDVVWGVLDVLLIDLPPGTDKLGDLAQLVPNLAGAIAVTIPTEESRRSVERAMRSAASAGVTLLGVIENMSGYECGGCGRIDRLFEGQAGAALTAEFGVPLLAALPFRALDSSQPPALDEAMLVGVLSSITTPASPAP
ncbi:MAG: P-loop NTPase [Anaerolineae bacterium]|nr:P-loop NTPase [Gemmatimonadaceae bacterium]